MAYGDILVQLRVPLQPEQSQLTHAEYIAAVTSAVNIRLTNLGITAAMSNWGNRTDLPSSSADVPGYVKDRLDQTNVDTSLYNFTLHDRSEGDPEITYCIFQVEIRCYEVTKVKPKDSTTNNDFKVDVALDQGLSVTAELRFVVRPQSQFPT